MAGRCPCQWRSTGHAWPRGWCRESPSLEQFRTRWIDPPSRNELLRALVTSGYSPNVVRMVDGRQEYDLFDVLAELGWGLNPRTRRDRTLAFTYKHED